MMLSDGRSVTFPVEYKALNSNTNYYTNRNIDFAIVTTIHNDCLDLVIIDYSIVIFLLIIPTHNSQLGYKVRSIALLQARK